MFSQKRPFGLHRLYIRGGGVRGRNPKNDLFIPPKVPALVMTHVEEGGGGGGGGGGVRVRGTHGQSFFGGDDCDRVFPLSITARHIL